MAKRYQHNDTAHMMFIGGVMIAPGEGREVDEMFLPAAAAADEAVADAGAGVDPGALPPDLADLLAQPVRTLVPALKDLPDDALAALHAAEQAGDTPRVTVLNAIGELQLQRAQARTGGTD